jgi:peptidoglycan hydrolase-like protein with peptidoglycan-binding domain
VTSALRTLGGVRATVPRRTSSGTGVESQSLRRPAIVRGHGTTATADHVLQLQRDAGNGAVTTLIQRKAAGGAVVLRRGAKGDAVRELQELLNDSGVLPKPIGVDGDYGGGTVQAVRAAQAKLEIGVDGAAGPTTMAKLRAAVSKRAAKAASDAVANERADRAWGVAAAAHDEGKWEQALAAYAEVVTLAEEAGNAELGAAAAARIREARLQHPPTPYGQLRSATKAAPDPQEIVAKRAAADAQYKAGQYAAALASYLEVYAGSSGGASEMEDTWSIASCHHQLGHFGEAVSWYRQTATHFAKTSDEDFAMVVNERVREANAHKPPTPSAELKQRYVDSLGGGKVDPGEAERFTKLQAKAQQGEARFDAKDYTGALAAFTEVYKEADAFDYRVAEVIFNMGLCHHAMGHFDTAIELYRQAREMNRGRAWFVGRLERLGGDATDAIASNAATREAASKYIAKALRHERG